MIIPGKNSLDVGVIVNDLPRCVKFYRDILGLKYVETVSLWYGKMVRMRFGESEFKIIKPDKEPAPSNKGLYKYYGIQTCDLSCKGNRGGVRFP